MGQNRKPNVRYLGILMSDSTPTNSSVSGVAVINKTGNKWGISCIFEHFRKMLTFSHIKYKGSNSTNYLRNVLVLCRS